jgi:hypothetical protein
MDERTRAFGVEGSLLSRLFLKCFHCLNTFHVGDCDGGKERHGKVGFYKGMGLAP